MLDEEALALPFDSAARRRDGVYFTPASLVERVLGPALALAPTGAPLTVIDPACGAGAFLAAAQARTRGATLLGLELAEASARRCRMRLGTASATVLVGDALRGGLDRLLAHAPAGNFELWVGSPPVQIAQDNASVTFPNGGTFSPTFVEIGFSRSNAGPMPAIEAYYDNVVVTAAR